MHNKLLTALDILSPSMAAVHNTSFLGKFSDVDSKNLNCNPITYWLIKMGLVKSVCKYRMTL